MLLASGRKAKEAAARDPQSEALLRAVMKETELQAEQKFVGPPMSKDELIQKYSKEGR